VFPSELVKIALVYLLQNVVPISPSAPVASVRVVASARPKFTWSTVPENLSEEEHRQALNDIHQGTAEEVVSLMTPESSSSSSSSLSSS
jgi:hypothetical protein